MHTAGPDNRQIYGRIVGISTKALYFDRTSILPAYVLFYPGELLRLIAVR